MAERLRLRGVVDDIVANPFYKLLSLAIAVGAWLYVQGGQTTDVKVRAAIEWKLPQGLATTEPLPATAQIAVRGTRSATRRATKADVRLTADVSDADVGEHSLDLASAEITGMPQGVSITGFSPSTVRIVLDTLSTRKVKVVPVVVGDPADGYSVVSTVVDPPVLNLVGPRILVSDIVSVSTKPIDVSGLAADVDQPVELDLPWGLEPQGGVLPRVKVDVEPVMEARIVDGVPVVVFGGDGVWFANTPTVQVTLQGPASEVRNIGPDDMVVYAHLPDEPARPRYDVTFGPREGPRLSVVHPGGDEVRVKAVRPAVVEVTRP
jgi:hypothetical protein